MIVFYRCFTMTPDPLPPFLAPASAPGPEADSQAESQDVFPAADFGLRLASLPVDA